VPDGRERELPSGCQRIAALEIIDLKKNNAVSAAKDAQ